VGVCGLGGRGGGWGGAGLRFFFLCYFYVKGRMGFVRGIWYNVRIN
jgi:hypothetical protein